MAKIENEWWIREVETIYDDGEKDYIILEQIPAKKLSDAITLDDWSKLQSGEIEIELVRSEIQDDTIGDQVYCDLTIVNGRLLLPDCYADSLGVAFPRMPVPKYLQQQVKALNKKFSA